MQDKNKNLKDIRIEYEAKGFNESDCKNDPIEQFEEWFASALEDDPDLANAMHLSTTSALNRPEGRIILLKGIEDDGFVFYTNYSSRKGQSLNSNPFAALTAFWRGLHRQVQIEGRIEKISREASEDYFKSRPRDSQLSAYISAQSAVIDSRDVLLDAVESAALEFDDKQIPCPDNWGGYKLIADRIEFWQGQTNRLHDRLEYKKHGDEWHLSRLSP